MGANHPRRPKRRPRRQAPLSRSLGSQFRPTVDAELFDQQPQERFGLFGFAGGESVAESVGDGRQRLRVEGLRRFGQLRGERVLVLAERVELRVEVCESSPELDRLEVARLEGLVVAVEGALRAADLLGDRALLLLDRGPVRRLLAVGTLRSDSAIKSPSR